MNKTPTLKFVRLTDTAKLPTKAHEDDSGFDICADETVLLMPSETLKIKTGIAAIIPDGYELQVRPRSGLAAKHGIHTILGTVDAGYIGEIAVILTASTNDKMTIFTINRGDRIAQLVFARVQPVRVEEGTREELDASVSDRGANGFGSTGV